MLLSLNPPPRHYHQMPTTPNRCNRNTFLAICFQSLEYPFLHLSCNAVRGIYAILRMAKNNLLKRKVGSVYHLSLDTLKINVSHSVFS